MPIMKKRRKNKRNKLIRHGRFGAIKVISDTPIPKGKEPIPGGIRFGVIKSA